MTDKRATGIAIKGGFFQEECEFRPFNKSNSRISIIYGRNGSGKSSIAKGFYEIRNDEIEYENDYEDTNLLNLNGNTINIDDLSHKIFVFDENYIKRKIAFAEDGFDSIVMLGKQVEFEGQIKELEKNIIILENELEKTEFEIAPYEDNSNKTSPYFIKERIMDNLKKNWADRERIRLDRKTNSSVNETIFNEISKFKIRQLDLIKKEYDDKYKRLKIAKNGVQIHSSIDRIILNTNIENMIENQLSKTIELKTFSEREKRISEIISKNTNGEKRLRESKEVFNDDAICECPFCLQTLSKEYRENLLKSLSRVLDTDETTTHRNELLKLKNELLSKKYNADLSEFTAVDEILCNSIEKLVDKYNKKIDKIIELIDKKITSVYSPIINKESDLVELQKKINEGLEQLEVAKNSYNENISSKLVLENDLSMLNKEYAKAENESAFEGYFHSNSEKDRISVKRSEKQSELNKIQLELQNLNRNKENVFVAIELINKYIAYIFFEKDRLKLELDGQKRYIVKSRGNHVRLDKLSVGERNAIALCYYMSNFFHGKSEEEVFKEECLLILDDPISSFDHENKIGMYSFIRYILEKILSGNKKSRCLILTHKIEAVFNFNKICIDLKLKKEKYEYDVYELKNKKLHHLKMNEMNEYTIMIKRIFTYADNKEDENKVSGSIGNTMRRVLESYGTFNYRVGIDEVTRDDDILRYIDDKKRDHFQNLMYRLVLNTESHMKEQTESYAQDHFFDYIGDDEKRRTAKEILVFLNLLDSVHLDKHLGPGSIDKIKVWEKEIFY